jgi:hypothetical protein
VFKEEEVETSPVIIKQPNRNNERKTLILIYSFTGYKAGGFFFTPQKAPLCTGPPRKRSTANNPKKWYNGCANS